MTSKPPSADLVMGPLPPVIQIENLLSAEDHAALLESVLAN